MLSVDTWECMLRRRRADGGDAPEPAGAEPVAGEPATDRMGAGAAPEQQPVLDADGELVPTPTFIQEIIALHPMAYATVSARMIAGSGSLTLCLILHCAYLLLRSYPDEDDAMTPASPRLRLTPYTHAHAHAHAQAHAHAHAHAHAPAPATPHPRPREAAREAEAEPKPEPCAGEPAASHRVHVPCDRGHPAALRVVAHLLAPQRGAQADQLTARGPALPRRLQGQAGCWLGFGGLPSPDSDPHPYRPPDPDHCPLP